MEDRSSCWCTHRTNLRGLRARLGAIEAVGQSGDLEPKRQSTASLQNQSVWPGYCLACRLLIAPERKRGFLSSIFHPLSSVAASPRFVDPWSNRLSDGIDSAKPPRGHD